MNNVYLQLKTADRRAYELLDIVVKRGQRAFSGLIEALEETENQEVADRLKERGSPTSNRNYTSNNRLHKNFSEPVGRVDLTFLLAQKN